MIGDLTIAFAETVGTMWDSEEPIYSENIDKRAVIYFQHGGPSIFYNDIYQKYVETDKKIKKTLAQILEIV